MRRTLDSLIAILIVFTISLLTVSITYAWFTMTVDADLAGGANAGTLEINYVKGTDIIGSLIPSSNRNGGLNTSVQISKSVNSIDAIADLTIENIVMSDGLKASASALKWEVYKDSDSSPFATGTFAEVDADNKLTIVSDYELTTSVTTFTVYIWLNGNETDNTVMNQTFSAAIKANAINKTPQVG